MLKRYLVFKGDFYYPSGGWRDFEGSFDTLEEANESLIDLDSEDEWYHVIDSETGETKLKG